MADASWSRLTAPSKAALRWAGASAVVRAGTNTEVGALDMLAGILLVDVTDNEPRQLLDHFGVPAGAVLDLRAARRYDGDALLAAVRGLPADALPLLNPDVDRILVHALTELPSPGPDGLVPLRVLFGAVLRLDNPASRVIRRELTARGVDADAVIASYHDFLTHPGPYGDFLRERHPYRAAPVEVPAYQADQPHAEATGPADLVGIQAEVDAFAYLIASRALTPPLAVGLFGDWGSGKSFFLRSLQRRIDTLVNDPDASQRAQGELPFYQHVVQIEFNAWQYVEGDLWASLVEHLFQNLRISSDDDLLVQRQRYWIERLAVTDEQRDPLRRDRARLEDERRAAATVVEQRREERKAQLAELERQRREDPLAGWTPSPELRKRVADAAGHAGLGVVAAEAVHLHAALAEARDVLREANPALEPLYRGGRRYVAAVVGVLALTPLLSWALGRLDVAAMANAAAVLAWILGGLALHVWRGTSLLQAGLDEVKDAEAQLQQAEDERRAKLDDAVFRAEEQLGQAEQQLDTAIADEQRLAADAAAVQAQLAATTPASVLAEFLTDRTGSDDYRRHLRVPALIRRDLERLSNLVEEQNRRLEDGAAPRDGEYPINRIVLYIDDLDRCPTQLVIEVLQAVHLLLAFPLFVVVVAVDARWLAGSLREHYGRLLSDGESATPDDYLEKIFQVPFWVQPLDPGMRRELARGLFSPSVAAADAVTETSEPGQAQPEPIEPVDRARFLELVGSFFDAEGPARAWLEAACLTVTEQEVAFVDEVAPLLGTTPRSVKRFVNIYQLMKSMSRRRVLDSGPVILLLAISTGLPELARELLPLLERHRGGPFPLAKAVADPELGPAHQREQLAAWLTDHPDHERLELTDLPAWAALIRRFSFRL
ncbi:MAG: P-loop NTPase fold protein [Egibacteraceae bacterium]